jgi:hypothetical protein
VIDPLGALQNALDRLEQIAAHGTADTTVVHLDDLVLGRHYQLVNDADFGELVDDDGARAAP